MKLYLFTLNCGDGSAHIRYTFDPDYLTKAEQAGENGEYGGLDFWEDYGMCEGMDWINVPDGSTIESLGIHGLAVAGDWND